MAENKRNKENIKSPLNLSMYDKMLRCQNAYNRIFNYQGEFKINFICVAIENISPEYSDGYKAHEIIPEILEYKPSDKNPNNHWFSTNEEGMNMRKNILKELIMRFKLSED